LFDSLASAGSCALARRFTWVRITQSGRLEIVLRGDMDETIVVWVVKLDEAAASAKHALSCKSISCLC
jgi:hypothetical protein